MQAGVKGVVATSVPIGDGKATEFSARFYEALANQRTIAQAFELAQAFIETKYGENPAETPVVVNRGSAVARRGEPTEAVPWALYVKEENQDEVLNWTLPDRIEQTFVAPDHPTGPVSLVAAELDERYRILETLGEGGMGTVYLAQDLRHDRRVAIKKIRGDFIDEDALQRFELEIKLTSGLQHPRILPLLDSGMADGALFYVMPYIDGESLEQRLAREGQLPIDDALRVARHVADALDCAHSRDVVHRDIKPANIMLSAGHALVMDFGIARALTATTASLTSSGVAIGTPPYMSPEQAADATAVDARSDIYALGCVLYEMIVGHPPFTGRTVESIVRQHLTAYPPDARMHRPSTSREVSAMIQRALAKSPADRFQSAREFVQALETATTGLGAPAASRSGVHKAFLVIAAYLAGSWGVLALVDRVAETVSLPPWTVPFALVLLLVGLLVVVATTIVQATGSRLGASTTAHLRATAYRRSTGSSGPGTPSRRDRFLSLFRWRNVITGGVVAFALWGLVAGGLLVIPGRSGEPLTGNASSDESAAGIALPAGPRDAPGAAAGDGAGLGVATTDTADTTPPPTSLAEDTSRPAEPPPTTNQRPSQADSRAETAAALARARAEAQTARSEAEVAGARLVATPALRRADSLWSAATQAESVGRQVAAAEAFGFSVPAYSEASAEAGTILSARLDSARQGLDSLRRRADPETSPYAQAEALESRGAQAERDGDLPAALDALSGAANAYRQAQAAVETPPPIEVDEPSVDPEPPLASPVDRVREVMGRLERAFEAEDLATVQRVWVNLSASGIRGFREFFDGGRNFNYGYVLDPASLRSSAEGIEFMVTVRWEYEGDRGNQEVTPPFEQTFRLERTDAGDVLISR